jgi:hypothetical protein
MGMAARPVFWNKNCQGNNFVSLPILILVKRTQMLEVWVIRWSNKKCWQKKGETRDRMRTGLPFCDHSVNTIYWARIWGAHKHDAIDSVSLLGYDSVSIGSDSVSIGSDRLSDQLAATIYKVYAVSSYTTLTFKIVTEASPVNYLTTDITSYSRRLESAWQTVPRLNEIDRMQQCTNLNIVIM